MRRKIPGTELLVAFETAARHQSFTQAAEELSLTQSAVCRQISALEDYLGVQLFNRIKKRVTLSEAGQIYARQVRENLRRIEHDTMSLMAHRGAGGVLELAVIPTFATCWLIPRLRHFHAVHPGITLDLTTRAEPFMFTDTPFDAAIHYGDPVWPGALSEFLFGEDMVPVCSPALLKGRTQIEPAELEQLPLLHQSARPDAWHDWFEVAGLSNVNAMGGSRYELFAMLVEAAKAELGVTLVPRFFVLKELASGELVTPCPQVLHSQRSYYLVYPENKVGSASLQVFRQWLRDQAAEYREAVLEAIPA
ncbi:LysR family transcriptional regulator [Propionivibrio soli]|uniref:LysR family transcriptional regulator n=1 Tax=Propionivibrio soli TaxID=2976531 RepID=UPI0021E8E58B|nr:LysR family transcriptional regulator [Propionivibrio soli]